MKTQHSKFDMSILWIARIWAALTLAFFLFMIGGHLFGGDLNGEFGSNYERVAFVSMLTALAGLALSYKCELIGGSLALLSFISASIAIPEIGTNIYFAAGIAAPAVLFLIYGIRSKVARSDSKILSI